MIILHKAQRTDGEGEIKGFITKMWGSYHIIPDGNENSAYPVIEDSITPCLPIGQEKRDAVITQNFSDFLTNPIG